jgi:hypothetical protein
MFCFADAPWTKRYFGAVNRVPQIPPMLAGLLKAATFVRNSNSGRQSALVDTDRRFGLYNRQLLGSFSTQSALSSDQTQDAPEAIEKNRRRIGEGCRQCWTSFSSW